jgi:cell division septum initiation protein DivIVA
VFYENELAKKQEDELEPNELNKKLEKHIENFYTTNHTISQTLNELKENIKQKDNFDWKFWRW